MKKTQIQAIVEVMKFLTSKDFLEVFEVRDLINSCTAQLKKLEKAGVEAEMREEVYKIFEEHINNWQIK